MNGKQTLAERILSHAAGRPVAPGDLIVVKVDAIMAHDSIGPQAAAVLHRQLKTHIKEPARTAMIVDHVAPASNVATADSQMATRRFVAEEGIENFYDVGRGVCHQVMIEEKLVQPGQVAIGSDSHTTSYGAIGCFGTGMGASDIALAWASGKTWLRVPETIRILGSGRFQPGVTAKDLSFHISGTLGAEGGRYASIEFIGMDDMPITDRQTLCGMTTEIGAKVGLFPPTGEVAREFAVPEWFTVDADAPCSQVLEVNLAQLVPVVAIPPAVDDIAPVTDLTHVKVDSVFIGTCTNGRLRDLQAAAHILKGKHIAKGVRMLVIPASSVVLRDAVADGTLATLLDAGATIGTPGCGPCIGRHMGVLGSGEVCFSAGNRNFRGRMGSPDAEIYLGSAETAAATALAGHIADPRQFFA